MEDATAPEPSIEDIRAAIRDNPEGSTFALFHLAADAGIRPSKLDREAKMRRLVVSTWKGEEGPECTGTALRAWLANKNVPPHLREAVRAGLGDVWPF